MKKIFIISILFVTSLLFLAGCGDSPASNGTGRADTSPLFPESEATIPMNSIDLSDLSDGTWEYKRVYSTVYSSPYSMRINMQDWSYDMFTITSTYISIVNLTFSVSGGNKTYISQSTTYEYTMDDTNKTNLINFAAAHNQPLTWNGNTVTITTTIPATGDYLNFMHEQSTYSTFTTTKNTEETRFLVKLVDNNTTIHYLKKLN